jgi:hypothetical protein
MHNKESEMPDLKYVQEFYTQDTGGGLECDVFRLGDGSVLVIGEESIVLYEDMDAWESDPRRQKGAIFRFEGLSQT